MKSLNRQRFSKYPKSSGCSAGKQSTELSCEIGTYICECQIERTLQKESHRQKKQ